MHQVTNLICNGTAAGERQGRGVVVANSASRCVLEFFSRLFGDYIDCAAGGIATKQGALGTTQNFYTVCQVYR